MCEPPCRNLGLPFQDGFSKGKFKETWEVRAGITVKKEKKYSDYFPFSKEKELIAQLVNGGNIVAFSEIAFQEKYPAYLL